MNSLVADKGSYVVLLDDLSDYLTTGGVATAGTNMFIGGFLDQPDEQVSMLESGGFPPIETMSAGPSTHVAEMPTVQVLVRGGRNERQGPRTLANSVFHALSGLRNQTINGLKYHYIQCQPPAIVDIDANNRTVFSINCTITRNRSTG